MGLGIKTKNNLELNLDYMKYIPILKLSDQFFLIIEFFLSQQKSLSSQVILS